MGRSQPISPREFMANSPDSASKRYAPAQRYQAQIGYQAMNISYGVKRAPVQYENRQ